MMTVYSLPELARGYRWLEHRLGYRQVSVLHLLFGRDDSAWNRSHDAWPITGHVTLLGLVRNLWIGVGKQSSDEARSGYDWALVRSLMSRGHHDPQDLRRYSSSVMPQQGRARSTWCVRCRTPSHDNTG